MIRSQAFLGAQEEKKISNEKTITTPKTAALPLRPENIPTATGRDEVLRLAEEEISVGKRVIPEGATRVHRFVVDKSVEAQVTLHEERAKVVRRPVSDPSAKDVDWTDKTIEVTETTEEAVISKSAHVAEEVVIGKEGRDRVETVRDRVRHQEVEVQHVSSRETSAKKWISRDEPTASQAPRLRAEDRGDFRP